jgi:UDP-2-acetamido-3-amino-2,3-dideoxy-glucuronate N-acetyltransferase
MMIGGVALIGCGQWGKNLARNLFALGALRTVCDTNPVVLDEIRGLYPGVLLTGKVSDVFEDRNVQACVVAAPAVVHHALTREALMRGKDVFVEKPLALQVSEGRELVALAEKQKQILMVGHVLEYHPAVVRLKELVDEGTLGRIRYAYSARLNLGKVRTEENILWSFAPHDVSVMLRLLGEMPVAVSAHGGRYLNPAVPDVTVTTLSFASGVRGHIFVSWLHPYKEQRLVVVGDRGMAVFDDLADDRKLLVYEHRVDWINRSPVTRSVEPRVIPLESVEPLRVECEHFLECLRERAIPRTDGLSGLRVLEVLEACQRSLDGEAGEKPIPLGPGCQYYVHETAVVDEPCEIGPGTKIWHFSHVMANARIGARCNIGQNVFVDSRVRVGNNVKIQNNVSIYEGVVLEDDVFCGPSAVFTNVINPRSHVSRRGEFRRTLARRGATIGANATIICGVTLGMYSFVGAGAVVSRDVPDYGLVLGAPARLAGWMCECGTRLKLSVDGGDQEAICDACKIRYRRRGRAIARVGETARWDLAMS